MKKSTEMFQNSISRAQNIEELHEIISELPRDTLNSKLYELAEEHNMTVGEVQTKSGITKSLFYDMLNNKRTPKKPNIIRIGFALNATLEELNELLKLAQLKELYAKNKEDVIIIYGLTHNTPIEDIDKELKKIGSNFQILNEE